LTLSMKRERMPCASVGVLSASILIASQLAPAHLSCMV
jgi:hypothetical protein